MIKEKIIKEKNKGGRPRAFSSVEELQLKIDEYFEWAKKNEKPLTIERLACFLDVDRQTLLNYSEENFEYFGAIKKAKDIILASKVENLNGGKGSTAGIIFDLKNNHAMKDKVETENTNHNTHDITINIVTK